jgi:cyclic beta-1,2-glucan synthetase
VQLVDLVDSSGSRASVEDSLIVEKNIKAVIDGMDIQIVNNTVRVPLDGKMHKLNISIRT